MFGLRRSLSTYFLFVGVGFATLISGAILAGAMFVEQHVRVVMGLQMIGLFIFFAGMAASVIIAKLIYRLEESKAELERIQNQAEKYARLSVLGEMASGVAHEINNPLAVVFGKAALLRTFLEKGQEIDREKLLESLQKIETTAERISKIVKGLGAMARDGEKDPFKKASAKILIADAVEICHAKMYSHEIKLDVAEANPRIFVECRSTQVVQILVNLLSNALDAVDDCQTKWVRIEFTSSEQWAEFAVIDSGRGVPKALRKKIMQAFFTTKGAGKGTGLGLSISKRIAQSHNGEFFLDENSQNTRFVLRLPLRQTETKSESHAKAA